MGMIASKHTYEAIQPGMCDPEELIVEYVPTIKYIAQRIAVRLPSHISMDDLISAGVIGLMDAIEKYDLTRDNTFKTYAEFRIRGAMRDELRGLDWVPRSVRQKERSLHRAYSELERRFGRPAGDVEVAAHLEIDLEEFYSWLQQVRGVSLLSLEMPGAQADMGETVSLLDFVSAGSADEPQALMQNQCARECIAAAIDNLPYQEKVVISLYYHEELTMKEIGKVLEITESRVSQIHTKAIFHLRARLKMLREDA